MRRRVRSLAAIITVGLLVAACGGNDESGSSGSSGGTGQWPADLVAAAKKEGKLVMVTSTNIRAANSKIFEAFGDEFGIDVEQTSGSSSEVNSRVLAERAQGVYTVDVAILGETGQTNFIEANAYQPLQPLLFEPDIQDRSLWYLEEFPWLSNDTEKKYVSDYLIRIESNLTRVFYNSQQVKPSDLTSFADLATNPKWKGKIVTPNIADPNGDGALTGLTAIWLDLGQSWFDQLFQNNPPTVIGPNEPRQIVDGLARGQWSVCIFCDTVTADATSAERDGLPVAHLTTSLKEGALVNTTGHFAVFDRAPHPNAAKLFVNWILSKEGQTKINELLDPSVAAGAIAMRKDVPQGQQPDELWNALHNNKIELRPAEEFSRGQDEVKAYIPQLFKRLGISPK